MQLDGRGWTPLRSHVQITECETLFLMANSTHSENLGKGSINLGQKSGVVHGAKLLSFKATLTRLEAVKQSLTPRTRISPFFFVRN
jgi:hypothetical protein